MRKPEVVVNLIIDGDNQEVIPDDRLRLMKLRGDVVYDHTIKKGSMVGYFYRKV